MCEMTELCEECRYLEDGCDGIDGGNEEQICPDWEGIETDEYEPDPPSNTISISGKFSGDTAAQAGEVVKIADPGRFDVVRGDSGILHRFIRGVDDEVFGVLFPELAEFGAANAYDGCRALHASHGILLATRHGPALPVVVVEARPFVQPTEGELGGHADLDVLRVAVGHREEDAASTLQVQHQSGHRRVDIPALLEMVECVGVDRTGPGQLDSALSILNCFLSM